MGACASVPKAMRYEAANVPEPEEEASTTVEKAEEAIVAAVEKAEKNIVVAVEKAEGVNDSQKKTAENEPLEEIVGVESNGSKMETVAPPASTLEERKLEVDQKN